MAGIFEMLGKVFGTDPAGPADMIKLSWLSKLDKDEKTARDEAQTLLDWYQGDKDKIVAFIKKAAGTTFDAEDLAEWQWVILNGVKRTIRRLATAYKEAPERKLVDKDGNVLKDGHPAYAIYEAMFKGMDMDKKMKEVDRMATFFNTVHVEVVHRKGAIDWDLKLRPISFVVADPEDAFQPYKFAYEWNLQDPETLDRRDGWVVWTEEHHKWVGTNNAWFGISDEDGSNPYEGQMPIVVVRKEEHGDYWGEPLGAAIVDEFQQLSLQLSNMWENGFMQTHGQPFGVNLGVPEGTTFRSGPKKPWLVDGVGKDKVPPSLSFPKPEVDIEKVIALLDWFLKAEGATKSLPPSAWSGEEKDLSGVAKKIDNMELMEVREEELPMWVDVEEELFQKSVMVWNRWPDLRDGQPEFPEDITLQVVHQPVTFPEATADKLTNLKVATDLNVDSPVHFIAREEGISLDEAMDKVLEIVEANQKIKKAKGPSLTDMPPIPAFQGKAEGGQQDDQEPEEGTAGTEEGKEDPNQ